MKDTAIRNLYTNVSSIIHSGDGTSVARDDDGNIVSFDADAVATEVIRLQAEYDNNKYQRDREPNYPPMTDYLDGIVKGDQTQIDKYIADCLAVKEKYPKGGN